MPLAIRYSNDETSSAIVPLDSLHVQRVLDARIMARLQNRTEDEMHERFDAGHRAYVATIDGEPAAFGWVATTTAHIGELRASVTLPSRERYLWNFVTLRAHRGKGIYPRLLDAIVRVESREADRFWIAYAPENHASGAGITKAGFRRVAELSFDARRRPAVHASSVSDADTVSRLLGLPIAENVLSQCWRCARATTSVELSCSDSICCCDYQRPEKECVA